MSILLTIDVEDYFQVENLRPYFPTCTWNGCGLRVEGNTRRLLDLFDQRNVRATFFVLGWIAERCPGLVREIGNRGHEVASHGYSHRQTFELSKQELRDDLYRSKALLEDLTGEKVVGYRAPKFSLSKEAWELLSELGYSYDSSYNPGSSNGFVPPSVLRQNGPLNGSGVSILPQSSFVSQSSVPSPQSSLVVGGSQSSVPSPQSSLVVGGSQSSVLSPQSSSSNGVVEIPIGNLRIGRWVVPMGGGGYFRMWPASLFKKGVARILRTEGRYVFYMHPWEIDPDQPRPEKVGGLRRFKHYVNLDKTLDRLDRFVTGFKDFPFLTCKEYVEGKKGLRTQD